MNRICIISDTHGDVSGIEQILPTINSCEFLVFLGDHVRDLSDISDRVIPPILSVRGNCDYWSDQPEEFVIDFHGKRLMFTHGHNYRVKYSLLSLALRAKERNCDFAFYGHTHVADQSEYDGVKLVNPGSISAPRAGKRSYCLLTEERGEFFAKIICL